MNELMGPGGFPLFYSRFPKTLGLALAHSPIDTSPTAEIRALTLDRSQSGFPHLDTAILLRSSLANSLKQNIYLVWVLFCLCASGRCPAGKIDFHPHSCFAEWIMLSSRISLYVAFVLQPLRPRCPQTLLCLVSIILSILSPHLKPSPTGDPDGCWFTSILLSPTRIWIKKPGNHKPL